MGAAVWVVAWWWLSSRRAASSGRRSRAMVEAPVMVASGLVIAEMVSVTGMGVLAGPAKVVVTVPTGSPRRMRARISTSSGARAGVVMAAQWAPIISLAGR